MRLAVVEPVGRGGLIHYAFQLCRALAAEGADVTLVTDRHYELAELPHPFRLAQPLALWDAKPAGPASRLLRLRRARRGARYLWEWERLLRWLRRERFDVVQLGDVRFAVELPWLRRLRRHTRLLADVCHNVHPFGQGGAAAGTFRRDRLVRALYRRIYDGFDRVFVHFEGNRREFLSIYGLPPERVASLPHANEELFRELRDPAVDAAALRRRHAIPADARVVLLFGTLSPYKGADLLVEAFARLAPRHPEALLAIVGFPLPGFDTAATQEALRARGLAGRAHLVPGYVPSGEVAAWMELAEVAAFPYREVSQSGALLTALTFGVPCVASSVGALPEILGGEGGGLLVPPGDPAALASALDRLLGDPEEARRLGERGVRAATGRFAWERPARVLLDCYREGLAADARPSEARP